MTRNTIIKKILINACYSGLFFLLAANWSSRVLFTAGVFIGWAFLLIDEMFLSKYYFEKDEANFNFQQLITRSALFAVILIPLSLFVVTSTGSRLGEGLIMGLLLNLIIEAFQNRQPVEVFHRRFLAETKIDLNKNEIIYVLLASSGFFVLCNLLLIFN